MKLSGKTTRNLILIPFLLFVIAVLTLAFFPKAEKDHMPEPKGEAVWEYITETNSYKNWDNWPGFEGMYEGQSPHGAFLKLYVNDAAKAALNGNFESMPANAIIVKENYNKQKKLAAVTPMYKVEDYNPKAGDWFWAKYGADGKIMAEGKVGSCIDCHAKMKEKDYLFSIAK